MTEKQADFGAGRTIIWLASYPKSGNTWLRAMLTAYLYPDDPLNLNAMVGTMQVLDRQLLDDLAGISSIDLSPSETIIYQALLFREIAGNNTAPLFVKTHWAMMRDLDGNPIIPATATAGAVHIVRDPSDVVPSLAHHEGRSLEWTLELMSDSEWCLDDWPHKRSGNLPQIVGSWSNHALSWIQAEAFPVLRLRYEDMLANPTAALERVLKFSGFSPDKTRVNSAVKATDFAVLRQHETESGFIEKPRRNRPFFRSGKKGEGRDLLNREQVVRLLEDHGAVMQILGYDNSLPEGVTGSGYDRN